MNITQLHAQLEDIVMGYPVGVDEIISLAHINGCHEQGWIRCDDHGRWWPTVVGNREYERCTAPGSKG